MTKKKYVTTSTDTKERYKERNRQAAAALRKNNIHRCTITAGTILNDTI